MPLCPKRRLAMIGLLCGLSGCAQTPGPSPFAPDISPRREARRQEVVGHIQQQRDEAQYQAAVGCWERGDVAGCQKALQALLERSPEHVAGNYLLAELYFLNAQPQEARQILVRLIEQRPDAAAIHHTFGMVLDSLGDRALALEHMQQAARLEPENARYGAALTAMEHDRESKSGQKEGPKAELAAYEQHSERPAELATAADPRAGTSALRPAETAQTFASALARGDRNVAKSLLLAAARDARDDEGSLITLAVAALRHDQPAWAIQVLRTYQSPDTASAAYRRALGAAYFHAGDYAAEESHLRQALLLDNTSALSYFLLGCTLSRQQRQAEAETHLQQAGRLDRRYDRAAILP